MKLAVSAEAKYINAAVTDKFCRTNLFLIMDSETLEFSVLKFPVKASGLGTGSRTAMLVVNENVDAVLTGKIGPLALKIFEDAGVKIFNASRLTVKEALEALRAGTLSEESDTCADECCSSCFNTK